MIPTHVAIIMDGNGRWAKAKGRSRNYGHQKGADTLERVVEDAFNKGVRYLSLYAFSTENWNRPKDEVTKLLSLITKLIERGLKKLIRDEVRLLIAGDLNCLSAARRKKVENAIELTKDFKDKTLIFCFNYGSRDEIIRAVNKCVERGEKVDEKSFAKLLYTSDIPDVDLVIRTSGEQRLSNFLLWQSAYAELYFTPVMWPDFNGEELDKAIEWFSSRKRRFGKIDEQ
ncbi:MAG: di-trans,poly-cis-decaprenylcistransferase [Clostridia bacterium]|nr:di-trans,poly-cis-decaprenylcistransferase [Clostridia bacterium]